MKLVCGPTAADDSGDISTQVILFGKRGIGQIGVGGAAKAAILRRKLVVEARAWDFLAIAFAVIAADFAVHRDNSPDGWTREIELDIAVTDPDFWKTQVPALKAALGFLTTDRWAFQFKPGGLLPPPPAKPVAPDARSVALLSGGLDSLIGAIDLSAQGKRPLVVSQTVRGDGAKQRNFAAEIGGGLSQLQLNPNVATPIGWKKEDSQRARSLAFIAFGVAAATSLAVYKAGEEVALYICENGFIAINPPLTAARLGSLSTRTAHPEFLGGIQEVLDAAGLRVRPTNPYATKTKGEMMRECADQTALETLAVLSTSCGRFQRFNYKHCGRCVPCQVRRAAFLAWQPGADTTYYKYEPLGQDDADHSRFDDVRSVGMGLMESATAGLEPWTGYSLSSTRISNRNVLRNMLGRGLDELRALHQAYNVK